MLESLLDFLTSGHEEALVAAVATFKSLICSCIDENLIKKGVDQITASANSATRKSVPTVIEKVCATIASLLDYQYEAVWDMSFQIISTMFEKLGRCTWIVLLLSHLINSLHNWRRLSFLMILQIIGCGLFVIHLFFLHHGD